VSSLRCSCGAENEPGNDKCSFCGADLADASRKAKNRERIQGFRKGRALEEIVVYERQDAGSPVVSKLQKGDRVALAPDVPSESGREWVEVQTANGVQGFVLRSSRVSVPSPALGVALLGIGAVLLGTILYGVMHGNGMSVSKVAMIALGIYGAYAVLGRRR
jgi:hypothetical protein